MHWNWELPSWPYFEYDPTPLEALEKLFFQGMGGSFAISKHLESDKQKEFIVEILCTEGVNSAEIEGEILERESLQRSIQRHFGIQENNPKLPLKEQGMGELLWEVYQNYQKPLTHETLYQWHQLLMKGDSKIANIGRYRTHEDPMQIIGGRYDKLQVHFEAPPSHRVYDEMSRFIEWFNDSSLSESILAKASIAHVYFESIHPFEDGNGRIGRALIEKMLSTFLKRPTLLAISQTIAGRKKEYYKYLGECNKNLNAQNWVLFFSDVIVQSQKTSFALVNFLMEKSKLMNRLKDDLNPRQEKAILKMFSAGLAGFSGGLSAENYLAITKTSRATATRDLADLVEKKALYKTGELKHTRYWLNIQVTD